jgi:hypothetical protein
MMHEGKVGPRCEWMETLRPLCYLIWHIPELKDKLQTRFSDWSKVPFGVWLRRPSGTGMLSNYLCMVEFMVSIRGLPVLVG